MDNRVVGVLGGGQLGRMLVESGNNRNIRISILDKKKSPAKQVNGYPGIDGSFTDAQAIRELAKNCDILTVEIEHVDTYVLEELEKESLTRGKKIEIQPSWETIRIIQDKYLQKQRLIDDAQIDVAESRPIVTVSREELQKVSNQIGLPFMLKCRKGAYDGRGNYPVKSFEDFDPAMKALRGQELYAEKWVDFAMEIAVMVVKTKNEADPSLWESSTKSFPTVETVHQDSICKLVYAPARGLSQILDNQAQKLARRAVASFKGKGVFGVEMFLQKDTSILVNEIAPRPHNSGHYTIEACRLSQFDALLNTILDRPIQDKSLQLLRPAIMLNIIGGSDPHSYLNLANAADAAGAKVHLYGKSNATKGRKMGHLTLVGVSMLELEGEMRHLITGADRLHDEQPRGLSLLGDEQPRVQPLLERDPATTTTAPPPNQPEPSVSTTTESTPYHSYLDDCYNILNKLRFSDIPSTFQPKLKECYSILNQLLSSNAPSTFRPSSASSASSRDTKNPLVVVTMGSDSDLPVLKGAFDILEHFRIPYDFTITSAHRTPHRMVELGRSAASRGVRVLIAAAGGAAHLPGMLASETTVPVIGIPIKATHLGGIDSVLSMVQMPRGIPVAVVGINNSVNAGLLAVLILGSGNQRCQQAMADYKKGMSDEVEAKAARLQEVGVENYLEEK